MKSEILFIGNYPPPFGGVPHHIERLTSFLGSHGIKCHVLAGGTNGNIRKGNVYIYKPTYFKKILALFSMLFDNTFNNWLGNGKLNYQCKKHWIRYKIYTSVAKEIIRKNNIGLISSYNLLSYSPVGAYLHYKYDIPHVINLFGEVYKNGEMLSNKFFFKKVIDSSIEILSCSTHCGNSLKLLEISRPVVTVTYGVNLKHFNPYDSKKNGIFVNTSDRVVILFVGRLSSEMGLDTFIELAKNLNQRYKNLLFLAVGQTGDLSAFLKKESELFNGNFLIRENVPYDDLPSYYRLASIVIIPTRGDRTCSSLASMEAMATKKAVVAYAIGGIPEIINDTINGYLCLPEDLKSLEKRVCELLDDKELLLRISINAYNKALNYFDENNVNIKIHEYFSNYIN